MARLIEREAKRIQPGFITIDPERDRTQVMHKHVTYVDPGLFQLNSAEAGANAASIPAIDLTCIKGRAAWPG